MCDLVSVSLLMIPQARVGERMMPGDEYSDWIQTYTGRKVFPFDMRPEDIDIRDIAHALSMKCRYTGHCGEFFSIAQHSVLMARYDLPGTAIWRLFHDAAEAYLPDIASPIKHRFPEMIEAENRILKTIQRRFDLPDYDQDEVEKADIAMCVWEGRRLFPDSGNNEIWWRLPDQMPGKRLFSWAPLDAKNEFMCEAARLLPRGALT